MNSALLKKMRQELLAVVQKYAGWMSQEQLIDLSRDIGQATEKVEWKQQAGG